MENRFPLKESAVLIVLVNPGMKSQMKMTCSFFREGYVFVQIILTNIGDQ